MSKKETNEVMSSLKSLKIPKKHETPLIPPSPFFLKNAMAGNDEDDDDLVRFVPWPLACVKVTGCIGFCVLLVLIVVQVHQHLQLCVPCWFCVLVDSSLSFFLCSRWVLGFMRVGHRKVKQCSVWSVAMVRMWWFMMRLAFDCLGQMSKPFFWGPTNSCQLSKGDQFHQRYTGLAQQGSHR